ncbi:MULTISPECIES: hypothetical protein [unclassified Exiguobacterium]|uniref:hypothetical protein n=1 Tax=unclassified Exiguobacterium TaxID=2644629 RepID=UPI001BEB6B2C|nr:MULTISPECIES: hypothetical protein [unclassified Exiguobacterium]
MSQKNYTARFIIDDKVTPGVRSMKASMQQTGNESDRLSKRLVEMDKNQDKLGRSTRQTTDAVERMKRTLSGIGTGFNNLGSQGVSAMRVLGGGLKGIVSTLTSLPAMIAGAGAAFGAWKLGEAVLGGAMNKELSQMQMGALLADKGKGKELFGLVQDKAMTSMFAEKDFAAAATTFLPVTKDFSEISRMMDINERLASSNPLEGMEGASFSMREALSGDIASIADRFNISKKTLRESGFSSDASWQQNLNAVDKTLDKMGYTAEYVAEVNDSAYAQWELFKSNALKIFADSGEGILSKLKDPLKQLNATLGSQQVARFVEGMGDGLANMFQRSLSYVEDLDLSWSDVETWAKETWDGASEMMKSAWGAGKELVDLIAGEDDASLTSAFINLGKSMEGVAKTLDAIANGFNAMEKTGSWLSDNMSGKPLIRALTGKDTYKFEGGGDYGPFFKQVAPFLDMPDLWNGTKKWANDFFGFDPNAKTNGRLRGSHRAGLSYVPYDGYIAELHKGEQVVPAQAAGRGGGQVLVTGNTFHVRQESDIDAIGKAIANELRLKGAM